MLQNIQPPLSSRISKGVEEGYEKLRKAIIATINENLRIEPVMTRRSRMTRAQDILKAKWTTAVISAGDIKSFEKDIEKRKISLMDGDMQIFSMGFFFDEFVMMFEIMFL